MYPPHHLGGYELSCRDVVRRWRAAGHHVEVLTTDMRLAGVDDPPDERANGVRRDLRFYWRDHEIIAPSAAESARIERHNGRTLEAVLREVRPDVVSAWHMGAMSLSLLGSVRRHGIPLVAVVCDDWMVYGPDVDGWLRRFRHRRSLGSLVAAITRMPTTPPSLDGVVSCFVSGWIRDRAEAESRLKGFTSTLAYSGIDHDDFPPVVPQAKPWRWRLLCVGRVEERKGIHIAMGSLVHLPDATLTVSGPVDETYLQRLNELGRELDVLDRVTFTITPRERLHELYAEADAFLFPVVWDEPFGLTPLEAMACGTPVVGTVRGGSREFLIDGVNCVETASGDAHALSQGIQKLADDAELRERLVRAGIITAAELSVDRYAEVLGDWHEAASKHFADGRPPERPTIRSMLAAKGVTDET